MPLRVGLVELHVDLVRLRQASGRTLPTVLDGVTVDRERPAAIRAALDLATEADCDIVVFPGWTVVGRKPPAWLLARSMTTTLVFECVVDASSPPQAKTHQRGAGRFFYVVRDGSILVGPCIQRAVSAGDFRREDVAATLLGEIRSTRRVLGQQRGHDQLLLICGEANIVSGGGASRCRLRVPGARRSDVQAPLVLNPAHTPMRPQAMRDKRKWLSRGGALVTTANTFAGLRTAGGTRSTHTAAKVWRRGVAMDEQLQAHPVVGTRHVVKVVDLHE